MEFVAGDNFCSRKFPLVLRKGGGPHDSQECFNQSWGSIHEELNELGLLDSPAIATSGPPSKVPWEGVRLSEMESSTVSISETPTKVWLILDNVLQTKARAIISSIDNTIGSPDLYWSLKVSKGISISTQLRITFIYISNSNLKSWKGDHRDESQLLTMSDTSRSDPTAKTVRSFKCPPHLGHIKCK